MSHQIKLEDLPLSFEQILASSFKASDPKENKQLIAVAFPSGVDYRVVSDGQEVYNGPHLVAAIRVYNGN